MRLAERRLDFYDMTLGTSATSALMPSVSFSRPTPFSADLQSHAAKGVTMTRHSLPAPKSGQMCPFPVMPKASLEHVVTIDFNGHGEAHGESRQVLFGEVLFHAALQLMIHRAKGEPGSLWLAVWQND